MVLRPAKTKSILIATRQKLQRRLQPLQLQLNAEPVERVTERKFLGIHVDEQLSWETHTNAVCKTIAKNTFLLYQLRHVTDYNYP